MKVLFAGLGSIGTRHLKNLFIVAKERGLAVEADALRHDPTRPLPPETASLLHAQLETLPEDARYDAVFITNPTVLHYELLQKLSAHTDCFFIEKPIFETDEKTPAGAGLTGKKAYVAAPMRWSSTFRHLAEYLADKPVFSVRAICSSYLPGWRKGVDYRTVYSARRELGGGVAIDLVHEWDYLVELFGWPEECHRFCGKYSDLEVTSDDLSVYIARYPGMLVEIHLDYFGRQYRRTVECFCPKGTVTADFGAGTLTLEDGSVVDCKEPVNEWYLREMRYFLEYAQSEEAESVNSPEKAWRVLKLALGEDEKK